GCRETSAAPAPRRASRNPGCRRTEPDPQRLLRPGDDEHVFERPSPVGPAPGNTLLPVQLHQQFELRAVEHVVIALFRVEDREGDRRRTTPGDRLDATGRDRRRRGELLEYADRLTGIRGSAHRWRAPCPAC